MIPDERLQLLRGPMWLATAALIAAVMLIAAWLQQPAIPETTDLTVGALSKVTLENPEELDAVLLRLSQTSLPDVTQPGGALERLAKF